MNYEYEGYNIDITNDYYLISKTLDNGGYIRLSQTMQDSPYGGATLQEKAEAHVDALIAESQQEKQKQATLEDLQQTLQQTNEGLVQFYYIQVVKEAMEITEVPIMWRAQVQAMLDVETE